MFKDNLLFAFSTGVENNCCKNGFALCRRTLNGLIFYFCYLRISGRCAIKITENPWTCARVFAWGFFSKPWTFHLVILFPTEHVLGVLQHTNQRLLKIISFFKFSQDDSLDQQDNFFDSTIQAKSKIYEDLLCKKNLHPYFPSPCTTFLL